VRHLGRADTRSCGSRSQHNRDLADVVRGTRAAGAPRGARPPQSRSPVAAARPGGHFAFDHRNRDPSRSHDWLRAVHRPRHGRGDRRDGGDRARRDALSGSHARRHGLCHRQAPSDRAGQRHDRGRCEAARPDHRRSRRKGRRGQRGPRRQLSRTGNEPANGERHCGWLTIGGCRVGSDRGRAIEKHAAGFGRLLRRRRRRRAGSRRPAPPRSIYSRRPRRRHGGGSPQGRPLRPRNGWKSACSPSTCARCGRRQAPVLPERVFRRRRPWPAVTSP